MQIRSFESISFDGNLLLAGRKLLCGAGGGVDTEAHFPNPPPSLLGRHDGRGGGFRAGAPNLPCRGGGGGFNPTSMAQKDTHVARIILTTQMWGRAEIIGAKNFFGPNFVFLCLWREHPFLHKAKGPTRNPISPTPPPLLRHASMPPPPPAEQFSGCLCFTLSLSASFDFLFNAFLFILGGLFDFICFRPT